ncbi:response regulator [Cellvibrio sp.]|uniref:response regulator n=1 Tax=Cellvibrio sp. TaxID=1965322 RepID=UPI003964860A
MDFLNSLPSIVFSAQLSSQGKLAFSFCNDCISRFASITPESVLADANLLLKCIAEADRGRVEDALIQAIATHRESHLEFAWVAKPGAPLWMLMHVTPVDNSASPAICGLITDITESHQEKVRAVEDANYFLYLQDHLPDVFYFKDRNSIFRGGNRAWLDMHGFKRLEDAIGKSDLTSGAFSHELAQTLFEQEQEMMRTGIALHEQERHLQPDGSFTYVDAKKVPLYNDRNQVVGMVGLTRDITELVKTQMALESAKLEAEQAAKAKSSFLAVMSHEIRTPMNGVIGCASLLASTPLNSEQEQLLHTIQTSGESLLVLINDILDYSKIEAGKINLEHSPFQLRLLIEDCIELFSKQAADKLLELNYFIEADVPLTLNGDATRIRQIINNLVGNAIKFTSQGEVFIEVSLSNMDSSAHRCGLLIRVKDTGIGISDENKSNLFNAFTQADNSITRKFGGTGLGLVICKKIVEQMDGEIWFESELGVGTTFFVRITLDFEVTDWDGSNPSEKVDLKGLRVLIVDDNATNRKVLANTVIQWGMLPAAFHSPETTLENLAFGHEYDLVLLDFCMPKTNGCDLAKKIKQLPHMQDKPIVILSSATTQREEMHHVDACLLKPVRNSILHKTVAQAVGRTGVCPISKPQHIDQLTTNSTRILIVEDNTVNQMVIGMMLKKLGYTNFSAVADGEEAVELCKTIDFDIIFMDIQMLRMDGYTAARFIRQQTQKNTRPWIIALTAGAQKEDSERAFSAGMNAFTTKPIQIDSLKAVLANAENSLAQLN